MSSLLETVLHELEAKAAYLCSLYRSHSNATKGNYSIQIDRLRKQIEELELRIAVLEEKQEEYSDTASILKLATKAAEEIKILNILAEMLGSPVSQSCVITREGKYKMFRGYAKGKAKNIKSISPTKKNISLAELLNWCRSNLVAIRNGDKDRMSILIDEYVEK